MNNAMDLLARLCLAFFFSYEAYDILTNMKATKAKMVEYGLTWNQEWMLNFAVVFLIVGAIFLLIGYRSKFASFLLLLYWLPLTFIIHSFWNDPVEIRPVQSTLFMRNIAIAGGLILVIIHGSGQWSIKRVLDRRRIKVK